ncbi:UNKNOWN [Stylonychia lemnae]|uniref:Uncharacterized protein n=1 Tax=Stylonychia lemnae TaxID=5949 RepID=A0A078AQY4_STYLE|nr:UNKNOWN [Stylonychia lemnae]|eukprot:CDW84624.1 UNKNOWN [Stylonychia lemnae]
MFNQQQEQKLKFQNFHRKTSIMPKESVNNGSRLTLFEINQRKLDTYTNSSSSIKDEEIQPTKIKVYLSNNNTFPLKISGNTSVSNLNNHNHEELELEDQNNQFRDQQYLVNHLNFVKQQQRTFDPDSFQDDQQLKFDRIHHFEKDLYQQRYNQNQFSNKFIQRSLKKSFNGKSTPQLYRNDNIYYHYSGKPVQDLDSYRQTINPQQFENSKFQNYVQLHSIHSARTPNILDMNQNLENQILTDRRRDSILLHLNKKEISSYQAKTPDLPRRIYTKLLMKRLIKDNLKFQEKETLKIEQIKYIKNPKLN